MAVGCMAIAVGVGVGQHGVGDVQDGDGFFGDDGWAGRRVVAVDWCRLWRAGLPGLAGEFFLPAGLGDAPLAEGGVGVGVGGWAAAGT